MREAVIVSTARTPIGKAYRGGFNNLGGASLGAASVAEAVKRAGVDPERVDDVIMGCALQQGATGSNIARQIALRAGLPVTVPGMTVDRQCSSGLMAVAIAARQIIDAQNKLRAKPPGLSLRCSAKQKIPSHCMPPRQAAAPNAVTRAKWLVRPVRTGSDPSPRSTWDEMNRTACGQPMRPTTIPISCPPTP